MSIAAVWHDVESNLLNLSRNLIFYIFITRSTIVAIGWKAVHEVSSNHKLPDIGGYAKAGAVVGP